MEKKDRMYRCAICGKLYNTIEERNSCELSCLNKVKERDARNKEEEFRKEKENDLKEINSLYANLKEKISSYDKKYKDFIKISMYRSNEEKDLQDLTNLIFGFKL